MDPRSAACSTNCGPPSAPKPASSLTSPAPIQPNAKGRISRAAPSAPPSSPASPASGPPNASRAASAEAATPRVSRLEIRRYLKSVYTAQLAASAKVVVSSRCRVISILERAIQEGAVRPPTLECVLSLRGDVVGDRGADVGKGSGQAGADAGNGGDDRQSDKADNQRVL